MPICKMSTESMDSLDIVHGISGKSRQSPWILWTKSREPTQTGQCPWTQWTLRLDNVHGLSGNCPLSPWIMSVDSLDNVHGLIEKCGHCPLIPWTMSRQTGQSPLNPWTPWTLTMDKIPLFVLTELVKNLNWSSLS